MIPLRMLLTLLPLLASPLLAAPGLPSGDESPDFVKDVWPILESRCIECHGPEKQKAGLRLDTREGLLEGDEGWIPAVAGKVDESYMIERILLPDGDSERMPPKGDRLPDAQVDLLRSWIEAGAEWEAPPAPRGNPAKEALALPPPSPEQLARVEETRSWYEDQGVRVLAVAQGMDAVEVNLGLLGERASGELIERLASLAPVLVHLNLSRTQIGDAELATLGKLVELRHLNLARTRVGDAGLQQLAGLGKLRYLNLYGTGVSDAGLQHLRGLGSLERLFLWQTSVTDAGVASLQEALPAVQVVRGTDLTPPEEEAKPINTECPVSGQPVDAATFSEVDGKRVAFCCNNCKGTFDADPSAFLEKLGLAAAKPVNAKCPVSGQDVDASVTSELDGKLVAFCCANCKGAFDKEPAKFRDKIEGL